MNIHKSAVTTVFFGLLVLGVLATPKLGASGAGQPIPTDLAVFTDVTGSAGTAGTLISWGASWGDLNNDGFPDLVTYCHDYRVPELYRNNGDGTFTDIVDSTPLTEKLDRHHAAWADYDNDGDQDVVISVGGQAGTGYHEMELYRNDDSVLVNVADEAGVSDGYARGRSVSWADYDRDGDLDFFAANHLREEAPNRLWRNNGDGTFTDVAAEAGVAASIGLQFGSFVDYDRDGWPDIFVLAIGENFLYHNKGDGTFEDVSQTTGFADAAGDSYAWGDYDGDGDADLFIGDARSSAADHAEWAGEEVRFFGDADGDHDGLDLEVAGDQLTFVLELRGPDDCKTKACIHIGPDGDPPATDPRSFQPFQVGLEAIGEPADYTPGVSFGYYIWRDAGTDLWRVRMSDPSDPGAFKYGGIVTATNPFSSVLSIDFDSPPPLGKAMLWRNEGDGTFTDRTNQAGMAVRGNYRSANWVDFDNDGWLDLYVTDKGNLADGNGTNHLFHNNGDGTFQDVAEQTGVQDAAEGSTNVSAWADFDRDGFLDLFTQNGGFLGLWPFDQGGPNRLFRNPGNTNHWLQLELVGEVSNRSGLGAVVRLSAGGRTQVQTHTDGVDFNSQNGDSLHFGLGESTMVDSIVIEWPSGFHQVLTDVPADQQLTIVEQVYDVYLSLILK